jgi:hypothetical protein
VRTYRIWLNCEAWSRLGWRGSSARPIEGKSPEELKRVQAEKVLSDLALRRRRGWIFSTR